MLPENHNKTKLQFQFLNNQDGISADDAIISWCEHDAIHYLSQSWFDIQSEIRVSKIEKHFNCGWYKHGLKYNKFADFELKTNLLIPKFLTIELIKEVSNQFKHLLY